MRTTRYLLFSILLIAVFIAGFVVGRFSAEGPIPVFQNRTGAQNEPSEARGQEDTSTGQDGARISGNDLTPGQRRLLETLGINADNVVVTKEMIACAEAKLGVQRIDEIQNGATPSFTEGVKLMACYTGN